MEKVKPIICALALIITVFSAAHGGNIGGLRTNAAGNIGGLRTNAAGNIGGLRTNAAGNIGGLRTNSNSQGINDLEFLLYGNIGVVIRALFATSALV